MNEYQHKSAQISTNQHKSVVSMYVNVQYV